MSEESRVALDPATFSAAINPMRPTDIMVPGPVQAAPPVCPSGLCTRNASKIVYFLYVVTANPKGDVLLACLNCGYEAVYRVAFDAFEPRPGREGEPWRAPYRTRREAADQILKNMSDGKPTGFKVPEEAKKKRKASDGVKTGGVQTSGKPAEAVAAEVVVTPGTSPAPAPIAASPRETAAPAAPEPMTIQEAAAKAGVHVNKLSAAAKKGLLQVRDIGGVKIVMSTDLAAYVHDHIG